MVLRSNERDGINEYQYCILCWWLFWCMTKPFDTFDGIEKSRQDIWETLS